MILAVDQGPELMKSERKLNPADISQPLLEFARRGRDLIELCLLGLTMSRYSCILVLQDKDGKLDFHELIKVKFNPLNI